MVNKTVFEMDIYEPSSLFADYPRDKSKQTNGELKINVRVRVC